MNNGYPILPNASALEPLATTGHSALYGLRTAHTIEDLLRPGYFNTARGVLSRHARIMVAANIAGAVAYADLIVTASDAGSVSVVLHGSPTFGANLAMPTRAKLAWDMDADDFKNPKTDSAAWSELADLASRAGLGKDVTAALTNATAGTHAERANAWTAWKRLPQHIRAAVAKSYREEALAGHEDHVAA